MPRKCFWEQHKPRSETPVRSYSRRDPTAGPRRAGDSRDRGSVPLADTAPGERAPPLAASRRLPALRRASAAPPPAAASAFAEPPRRAPAADETRPAPRGPRTRETGRGVRKGRGSAAGSGTAHAGRGAAAPLCPFFLSSLLLLLPSRQRWSCCPRPPPAGGAGRCGQGRCGGGPRRRGAGLTYSAPAGPSPASR